MKKIVTITSKGQTTIPVKYRKSLGITASGGTLAVRYNPTTNELIMSQPLTIDALSKKVTGYIRPGTVPLVDANAFYREREGRRS